MGEVNQSLRGYIFAIGAYVIWGVLPLYWKALHHIEATEVLAYRILCSFVFLLALGALLKRKTAMAMLKDKKSRTVLLFTSVLISLNWGVYIFAVNNGHTVEASLGYYINPLVNVFLGSLMFKERLTKLKGMAIALAFGGVLYMTVGLGRVPWIALILATTFAFYGLFKKKYALDSINSLTVETMLVAPVALIYLLGVNWGEGIASMSFSGSTWVLLSFSGLITTVPLYLFGEGAKRIPFSSLGFLQYIGPSIMLFLGVYFFDEPFTNENAFSFSLIWLGLAVYVFSLGRDFKRKRVSVS